MTIKNMLLLLIVTCAAVSGFTPTAGWSLSSTRSSSTRLHATWSDARAVREYQDFLASGRQELEKADDGPCAIVIPSTGMTDMAQGLLDMGMGDDVVVAANEELPPSVAGQAVFPVYVTIPPTQLADFLRNMPSSYQERRDDLCFISGGLEYGNIEGVLKDFGYAHDATTQMLMTGVKLSPRVEDVSVRIGTSANFEEKWAGECAACGKWSGAIERRLEANAVRCKTVFYREWKRLMWEQTVYDAVFHLVGAVREQPTSVCDVALYYDQEVSDIVWEISGLLRGSRALTLTYGFEERMFGVAEARGADQPCVLLDHMYPYLYEPFEMAKTFMQYLTYAQDEMGLLPTVEIFRKSATAMDKPPIIRGGNMRADGVI